MIRPVLSATLLYLLASTTAHAQAPAHVPYTFSNAAIVAGGFITGIVPHPSAKSLMYLRTDIGGAYRWDADRSNWTPLTDWVSLADNNLLGIESIALDPTDASKLYLSVGTYDQPWAPNGAVLRSTDRGAHFDITRMPFKMGGNQDGRFAGERLAVDPNAPATLFLGSRNDGLWKSSDSARTWKQVKSFPGTSTNRIGVVFVLFDPASGHPGSPTPTLYAGVSSPTASLFRSTDAGSTWQPVPGAPAGLLPNHGVLAADGNLYLTFGDHPGPNEITSGAVYRFNPTSSKWKDISPETPGDSNPTFGYGGLAVDRSPKPTIMVSTIDRWNKGDEIFRSTDGGSHWTNMADLAVRDGSLSPYVNSADGTAKLGHWIGAMAIDPFDPNHALYGTGETVWATNDLLQMDAHKTTHWSIGAKGIEETAVIDLVSPPVGPHLFSGLGDIGCFRHEDLTVSPREGSLDNPRLSNCSSIDFAASNPNLMARVGGSWSKSAHGGFSTDNGLTWTSFPTEPTGSERGGTIALSADGNFLFWFNGRQTVSVSSDRGHHWSSNANAPPHARIASDRVLPERFYLYDPDHANLFVGDGPSFAFKPADLAVPPYGKLFAAPGQANDLWITTNKGLWHTTANKPAVRLSSVDEAYTLGFGMSAKPNGYPTLFISGKVAGIQGIFRSTDSGVTWLEVDDTQHKYGAIDTMTGDPRVFGRVYLGTNGLGVIVADPAN